MKKFKPTYLLIFTLLIAWVLFSNCSKDDDPVSPTDALVGTWNLTSATITFSPDSVVTVTAQDLFGGTFKLVINNNGTFQTITTTATGTETENGTWSVSGSQITITPEGQNPEILPYTLSGNTLTINLTIDDDQGGELPAVFVFAKQ